MLLLRFFGRTKNAFISSEGKRRRCCTKRKRKKKGKKESLLLLVPQLFFAGVHGVCFGHFFLSLFLQVERDSFLYWNNILPPEHQSVIRRRKKGRGKKLPFVHSVLHLFFLPCSSWSKKDRSFFHLLLPLLPRSSFLQKRDKFLYCKVTVRRRRRSCLEI